MRPVLRRLRSVTRSVGPSSRAARVLAVLAAFSALGLLGLSDAAAHVFVLQQLDVSAGSHPGMETLFARTVTTTLRCGTVRVTGVVQGTTSARGSISITLPLACRGATMKFFPALAYTDTNSNQAEFGLYTNSWTGNVGRVSVCLSRTAGGCVSTNLNVVSTTVPPATTSHPATALGTIYGPAVTVRMTAAGTATIVIILSVQDNRGGNNTPDAYQQMQIAITVQQR